MGDHDDGNGPLPTAGGGPPVISSASAGAAGPYRDPPQAESISTAASPESDTDLDSSPAEDRGNPPVGMGAHRASRLGWGFDRAEPPHLTGVPLSGPTLPTGPHLGQYQRGSAGLPAAPPGPPAASGDYDRGRKSGPYLPDPSEKTARLWNGEGTTLEDVIEWFETRAPANVEGLERMKLFAKYATPKARRVLETLPEVFETGGKWSEFLRHLRASFPDRTKLRSLSAQEFEERSKKLLSNCWMRKEDVVTAGIEFGSLVKQYTQESTDSMRANETYFKWCHQGVVAAIVQWYGDRWEKKGWDGESYPPWKWLLAAHVSWYDPKNQTANARLRSLRPEIPSSSELAQRAADGKDDARQVYGRAESRERRDVLKSEKKDQGEEVSKLIARMRDLSLQHKHGDLQKRRETAERYKATVQEMNAIPRGREAIAYWRPTLEDPVGDAKAFAEACATALELAETYGVSSAEYASDYAKVAFNAPAGKNVRDHLPRPTYMAANVGPSSVYPQKGPSASSYGADSTIGRLPAPHLARMGAGGLPANGNCFFCGGPHKRVVCPERQEFINKGWIYLHRYNWVDRDGRSSERLGDRWKLPGHPLDGQRVRMEGGKHPTQILEEVKAEVAQRQGKAEPSTAHHARVMSSEELQEEMETRWEEEDEELAWQGVSAYAAGVPGRVRAWESCDLEDLEGLMQLQWAEEDGFFSSELSRAVRSPLRESEARTECQVYSLWDTPGIEELGEGYQASQDDEEALYRHLFGADASPYESPSRVSVNQALVEQWELAEAYAAERGGESVPRPRPYPSRGGESMGKDYHPRTGGKPTMTGLRPTTRSVARATGAKAPGAPASTPAAARLRGGPANQASASGGGVQVKREPVEPAARAQGASQSRRMAGERPLVPGSLLPKRTLVSEETDWKEVCRKVVTGRGLGELSMQDLLVISPLLVSYLNGITRRLREGEGKGLAAAHQATVRALEVTECEEAPEESVQVDTHEAAVTIYETQGHALDREVIPSMEEGLGVYYSSEDVPPLEEVGGWEDPQQGWCTSPLSVKMVLVPVTLSGVRCQAIVDDGSQINMVSKEFYDRLTQVAQVGIHTDLQYSVSGVHGEPVPLLGYFEADLKIGALITHHVFWVNRQAPRDKIFLGMPFIAKNLVDFFWSGYRRIMRVHAPEGVLEVPLHPDAGPVITVAEERPKLGNRKPIGTRLRSLRRLRGPPAALEFPQLEETYVCEGTQVVEGGTVFVAEVESPEKLEEVEYTWRPREGPLVTTKVEASAASPSTAYKGEEQPTCTVYKGEVQPSSTEYNGAERCELRSPPEDHGDSKDDLWAESERMGARITEGHPVEQVVESLVSFVDTDDRADDCLELTIEDRCTRTRLLLGPTGRYHGGPTAARVVERETSLRQVQVYGAYKPVALKKRPVETQMSEEDKQLMKVPPGILDDLPEVRTDGPSLDRLQPGQRLTAERLDKVVFSMTDF